jgi:hypothetical protein
MRSFGHSRKPGPFSRLLATLLFVSGYALTSLHLLTEPHHLCPEHLEVVEGSATDSSGTCSEPATSHPPVEMDAARDRPGEAARHDHCHVLALCQQRHVVPQAQITAGDASLTLVPDTRTTVFGAGSQFPRYLLAPSHSPPTA